MQGNSTSEIKDIYEHIYGKKCGKEGIDKVQNDYLTLRKAINQLEQKKLIEIQFNVVRRYKKQTYVDPTWSAEDPRPPKTAPFRDKRSIYKIRLTKKGISNLMKKTEKTSES
jgi:hypothetical protein